MMQKKFNLSKDFINYLGEDTISQTIGQLLKNNKLIDFNYSVLIDDKQNMDAIASIIYTLDYLDKNNIIKINNSIINEIPPIFSLELKTERDRYDFTDYKWLRFSLQNSLKNIWNKKIELTNSYHIFVLNDYKTDEEKQRYWFLFGWRLEKQLWIPVFTAIIVGVLSVVLPLLFSNLSKDNHRHYYKFFIANDRRL